MENKAANEEVLQGVVDAADIRDEELENVVGGSRIVAGGSGC